MTALVTFDHATLAYGRRVVLSDLTFQIPDGDFLGLVGPNGAGKTTILRAILGTLDPIAGTVTRKSDLRFLAGGERADRPDEPVSHHRRSCPSIVIRTSSKRRDYATGGTVTPDPHSPETTADRANRNKLLGIVSRSARGRSKRVRCKAREEDLPRRGEIPRRRKTDEAERRRWPVFIGLRCPSPSSPDTSSARRSAGRSPPPGKRA